MWQTKHLAFFLNTDWSVDSIQLKMVDVHLICGLVYVSTWWRWHLHTKHQLTNTRDGLREKSGSSLKLLLLALASSQTSHSSGLSDAYSNPALGQMTGSNLLCVLSFSSRQEKGHHRSYLISETNTAVFLRHDIVAPELIPIKAVTFGLMIPLGRRWKSYSTESTTTVCPALFPPCDRGEDEKHQWSRTNMKSRTYEGGVVGEL